MPEPLSHLEKHRRQLPSNVRPSTPSPSFVTRFFTRILSSNRSSLLEMETIEKFHFLPFLSYCFLFRAVKNLSTPFGNVTTQGRRGGNSKNYLLIPPHPLNERICRRGVGDKCSVRRPISLLRSWKMRGDISLFLTLGVRRLAARSPLRSSRFVQRRRTKNDEATREGKIK